MMWDNLNQELFTQQYTRTFSQIYPTYEEFAGDWANTGLPNTLLNSSSLKHIYILLMGEYASSSIMSFSEDQFKLRLFTLIMSYGGQWEREFAMQQELLKMSDEDLMISSKAIYNTSLNPSEAPTTDTLTELTTINQQNVTKHVRSKLDAYALLESLLNADLTKQFIKRFDHLFVRVLRTNQPLYYRTSEDEATEDYQ